MKHQVAHRKFSRSSAHRKSLLRNLATSLVMQERFETTLEKAKDLKPVVEKLVTLAKSQNLAAKRQAYSYLMNKDAVHKLFADLAPRYSKRSGGYTRVVRSGFRHGDAAQMAVIEFLAGEAAPKKGGKKKTTKKAKAEAKAEKGAETAAE